MEWYLYKKDDPSTWPEIDCPILVYDESLYDFYICKWNPSLSKFVEPKENIIHYWSECYYQYINYIPSGYKTLHLKVCRYVDENGDECACLYGFDDDGYCFASGMFGCEHKKAINEYHIEIKRIWKEFE